MPNLKPCPHGCTGTPEPLIFTYTKSPRYRVVVTCSACGAAGGPVTGNDQAAVTVEACELWNRRVPDPRAPHVEAAVQLLRAARRHQKMVGGNLAPVSATYRLIADAISALEEE
jgi:Ni,Fe-hydrogenase III small subunit